MVYFLLLVWLLNPAGAVETCAVLDDPANDVYGWVNGGTSWPVNPSGWSSSASTSLTAGNLKSGTSHYQYWAFMRFDTSAIPNTDTIVSARLRLFCTAVYSQDPQFQMYGDYYDFGLIPTTSADARFYSSPLQSIWVPRAYSTFVDEEWNEIVLSDLTGISKTGLTAIRMSCQSPGPSPPLARNYITADGATLPNKPRLCVTHNPATNAPTSKSPTSKTPTTGGPTKAPTSKSPTSAGPTSKAPSSAPTRAPSSGGPTRAPTTQVPSVSPTLAPTVAPGSPTKSPTTKMPTTSLMPTTTMSSSGPTAAPTPGDGGGGSPSIGVIVGAAVGGLLVIAGIVLTVVLVRRCSQGGVGRSVQMENRAFTSRPAGV